MCFLGFVFDLGVVLGCVLFGFGVVLYVGYVWFNCGLIQPQTQFALLHHQRRD